MSPFPLVRTDERAQPSDTCARLELELGLGLGRTWRWATLTSTWFSSQMGGNRIAVVDNTTMLPLRELISYTVRSHRRAPLVALGSTARPSAGRIRFSTRISTDADVHLLA